MAAQRDRLPTPEGRRIIVGVDGSAMSLAGVDIVATLPLSATDSVVVATIAESPFLLAAGRSSDRLFHALCRAALGQARRVAEWVAERLIGLSCDVRTDVRLGHPVETLRHLVAEHQADLLVLGPHGRGQLGSVIFGGVSKARRSNSPPSRSRHGEVARP